MESGKTALDLVATYGLGTVLSVGIAIAFWRILVFVLKENSKREDRLAAIIEKHLVNLDLKIENLKSVNDIETQEHRKMLDSLDLICDQLRELSFVGKKSS